MKKTIKSLICAASAAVICAAPIAPTFAGISASTAITAEAADFITYNASDITLDASQVTMSFTDLSLPEKTVTIKANSSLKAYMNGVTPFQIQHIEFDFKRSATVSEERIKKEYSSFTVTANFDSSKEYVNSQTFNFNVKKTSTDGKYNYYHGTYEFLAYGSNYEIKFNTGCIPSNIKVTGKKADYYYISAEPSDPKGVKVCAVWPKSLPKNYVNLWIRDQCLLANSLNILTVGSVYHRDSKDTIFIIPDEYRTKVPDETPLPSGAYANSGKYYWTNGNYASKFALIKIGKDGTANEMHLIKNNPQRLMNRFMIHEMGHAFAGYYMDDFGSNYLYDTREGVQGSDEFFTNVRALTAMNNCTYLRKFQIRETYTDSVPLDKVYAGATGDNIYLFGKCLVEHFGFDKLEGFYNASTAISWKSQANIDFANKLSVSAHMLNSNVPKITSANAETYKNYLKFVDGLVGLYGYRVATDLNMGKFVNSLDTDFKTSSYSSGLAFLKNVAINNFGSDLLAK